MRPLAASAGCLLLFGFCPAVAETVLVRPDGSGDYPTIRAAVEAAQPGDVIELTDGTFAGEGNRDVSFLGKAITVRSQSGSAEACVIDCQGSEADPHRGFLFESGETSAARLRGITLTGGWGDARGGGISCRGPVSPTIADCRLIGHHAYAGAGIDCFDGAAPTLQGCRIAENEAEWSGGGLEAHGASPTILACTFEHNHARHGAAIYVYGEDASPWVSDCSFLENIAVHSTGGAHCEHFAAPTFLRCTFTGNRSLTEGSALTASIVTTMDVSSCTFWGNGGGSVNAALTNGEDCHTALRHTIIASTVQGVAISCHPDGAAEVTLFCCDLYGNEGGDWIGEIAGQLGTEGNICADPLFCAPETGDWTLQDGSPCAPFSPPNPECDLIGAWPVGCGGTPVTRATWGGIKASYR